MFEQQGGILMAKDKKKILKVLKERYTCLNAEFQRIAKKDKKQRKIEENRRVGKTRDLVKILEIPRKHFMQRWAQ